MLDSLRAFCLADSTIAGLLSGRLFVGANQTAPPVYPFTCVRIATGGSDNTIDGKVTRHRRVQFDHTGKVADCSALEAAFRTRLENVTGALSGTVRIISLQESNIFGPTLLPDPLTVHKLSQDFMISFAEN